MTILVLKITEGTELVDSVSKCDLTEADESDKITISIMKLNLFIMKKVASGSNTVALVLSLKKKWNELWYKYLEAIENDMEQKKINEGEYLELSTSSVKERNDTLELLDMLELGLVIKCVVI